MSLALILYASGRHTARATLPCRFLLNTADGDGTLSVHGVTVEQLRSLARACNALAEEIDPAPVIADDAPLDAKPVVPNGRLIPVVGLVS